jgi:hypothetical protein
VDRIGEVGCSISERQAAGVVSSKGRSQGREWGPGIKVGSDEKLMEVGKMAECD